jgi:pantetheine-phosphate adenylyltransferase
LKNVAIYPGTFDPITYGHVELIRRSASIFPNVIVLVSGDTKKSTFFEVDDRVQMVREAVETCEVTVRVECFHGLLVDAVRQYGAEIIIRGLRAVSDFEYESQMALMNRRLEPGVETFFMISTEDHAYLSSSFVKEIASLGGDVSSMVPPGVERKLKKSFSGKRAPDIGKR